MADLREDASACLRSGERQASSLAWSAPGEVLAYSWSEADRRSVRIWSRDSKSDRAIPLDDAQMFDLAWSPDGLYLAGGALDASPARKRSNPQTGNSGADHPGH